MLITLQKKLSEVIFIGGHLELATILNHITIDIIRRVQFLNLITIGVIIIFRRAKD